MFRLIWGLGVRTRNFMLRYLPTKILLGAIRTRRGLRWGVPAMLLVIPYLYVESIRVQLLEDGSPGWLHLFVVQFTFIRPVSFILLLRIRIWEATPKGGAVDVGAAR